ncbi:MAG: PilZ domain-containing protein [Desulfobulbaceae bacterium]|nr:PilZ domain-containing protein [Desulfobulbaceae bacterium]
MRGDQLNTERRKEKRYRVNERAIAVLKVGSRFTRLGQIVDVSRGGLAFDYLLLDGVFAETKMEDVVGEISLNIITEDGFVVLESVAVKPVNDRLLQREERFFATVPTCRCGVSFDNLSPDQGRQLGEFLMHHA